MAIDFMKIADYIPYMLGGVWVTLQVSFATALMGSIIGLLLSFAYRRKGWMQNLTMFWVDFFRGTPLLFQLLLFHYGLPQITGWVPTPYVSAIVVFSLNSSAYLSEILRAGIESIDKGQIEAAHALGVSNLDISFSIIIPQALHNVLPAIMNEFITLVKETSVVSIISLQDIMRRQAIVSAATYRFFEPILVVGLMYYVLNKILSYLGKILERKISYDKA